MEGDNRFRPRLWMTLFSPLPDFVTVFLILAILRNWISAKVTPLARRLMTQIGIGPTERKGRSRHPVGEQVDLEGQRNLSNLRICQERSRCHDGLWSKSPAITANGLRCRCIMNTHNVRANRRANGVQYEHHACIMTEQKEAYAWGVLESVGRALRAHARHTIASPIHMCGMIMTCRCYVAIT